MRQLIILFLILFSFSSCKREKTMLVIKDCTGTYLRFGSKDYFVCNYEDLVSFEDGVEVEAVYTKLTKCTNYKDSACRMAHDYETLINVDEISYK